MQRDQEVIASFRSALITGTAALPPIDSLWIQYPLDTYVEKSELADLALLRFSSGAAIGSTLAYVFEYGSPSQVAVAREASLAWLHRDRDLEELDSWLEVIPYPLAGVQMDRIMPYRKDAILDNLEGDLSRIWLLSGTRGAIDDWSQHLTLAVAEHTSIDDIEPIISLLMSLGSRYKEFASLATMEVISKLIIDDWKTRRIGRESDLEVICLSWRLLLCCWRFGWKKGFSELWNYSEFKNDCLGHNGFFSWFVIDIANNFLALSLLGIEVEGQTQEIILNLARLRAKEAIAEETEIDPVEIGRLVDDLVLGGRYPGEVRSMEARAQWCFQSVSEQDMELAPVIFEPCWAIWRLRLAGAIVNTRK
jgi:hypothetical protein